MRRVLRPELHYRRRHALPGLAYQTLRTPTSPSPLSHSSLCCKMLICQAVGKAWDNALSLESDADGKLPCRAVALMLTLVSPQTPLTLYTSTCSLLLCAERWKIWTLRS